MIVTDSSVIMGSPSPEYRTLAVEDPKRLHSKAGDDLLVGIDIQPREIANTPEIEFTNFFIRGASNEEVSLPSLKRKKIHARDAVSGSLIPTYSEVPLGLHVYATLVVSKKLSVGIRANSYNKKKNGAYETVVSSLRLLK